MSDVVRISSDLVHAPMNRLSGGGEKDFPQSSIDSIDSQAAARIAM